MECTDPKCRENLIGRISKLSKEHTGVEARVTHVENDTSDQWNKMSSQDDRINSIFTRFNFTLGGVVVMTLSVLIHTVILLITK